MKKLLLLLIIPFLSFGQVPITQENIYDAVAEWIGDPVSAEDTYGHIGDWDVSNVTSMYFHFWFYNVHIHFHSLLTNTQGLAQNSKKE